TVGLPRGGRGKVPLSDRPILLGLHRAVVDGLGLLPRAVGPCADLIGGGQPDPKFVEVVHVEHYCIASSGVPADAGATASFKYGSSWSLGDSMGSGSGHSTARSGSFHRTPASCSGEYSPV